MDWQTLWQTLIDVRWPAVPTLTTGWEQGAVVVLVVALALLALWEDWRLSLLAWAAVGVSMALLLVRIVPVPWALSRMLAAGLDGTLLWLGARRWPRPDTFRPGGGIWVRLPAVVVAAVAIWQARAYAPALWPDAARATVALALLAGGLLTIALNGDTLHATLGLLLWVNAAALLLSTLPIPTDWFPLLTLLDITLSAAGSVSLASEGAGARWAREWEDHP